LDALAVGIATRRVNWLLDADIRDYFSSLDHSWLERFLEHRIADRRVLRLIQKWLKAGVIEDGTWTSCDEGTPQGASISTLLSNVYLHYVFDLWVRQWRSRQARGDVIVTRFADDFVAGFEHRDDAERFLADLRDRFAEFNLELAEEKTRLIEFGRYAAERRRARGLPKPESFDFLGFTHICGKTRKTGRFALVRVTSKKRLRAKLREVKTELMRRRDQPIPEQGQWLESVVRGHCNYYAVPGNIDAVAAFRDQAARHWRTALRRRSQRTSLTWERMDRLKARWLPPVRIQHPWPSVRFDAKTRGKSPVRKTRTLGSVRGAVGNGRPYRYARHDQQLGGASPPWRLMAPTTSQGQLRRREARWEGSRRRNRDPRNTWRIGSRRASVCCA
jgi:RNA-directed DNA polymerase